MKKTSANLQYVVIRAIVSLLMPFIIMYGLYIQFHGEYSAGGGFQAGIICASAFIAYSLANDITSCQKLLPLWLVKIFCATGVMIYAGVGFITLFLGSNFLNYSVLSANSTSGQKLGIMLVELGVGLTVFSVTMIIFYIFSARYKDE